MLRGRGSKKRINYHLVGDTLFSSVPPSNSLVSISNPWRAFQRPSRTLDTPIALLPEPQRYKDSVRYDGLGADIQRQRQENLTQNLIFVFPKIWGGGPLSPLYNPTPLLPQTAARKTRRCRGNSNKCKCRDLQQNTIKSCLQSIQSIFFQLLCCNDKQKWILDGCSEKKREKYQKVASWNTYRISVLLLFYRASLCVIRRGGCGGATSFGNDFKHLFSCENSNRSGHKRIFSPNTLCWKIENTSSLMAFHQGGHPSSNYIILKKN